MNYHTGIRKLNFITSLLLTALMVTSYLAKSAHAQSTNTQVDVRMKQCEDKPRGNKRSALAYSRLGVSYCGVGGSERSAIFEAKRGCKKLVPWSMRKKAPCEIISTDLEVLEPYMIELLRQEVRIPVNLEVYDGDTEITQNMNAFLVYGGAIGPNFRSIQVLTESSQELCNGRYEITNQKFRFEIRCFDTFRFKDQKSTISGYFLYKGIYAPVFAAKLKKNESYITIAPPISTKDQ